MVTCKFGSAFEDTIMGRLQDKVAIITGAGSGIGHSQNHTTDRLYVKGRP